MPHSLFISDLHLSDTHSKSLKLFEHFVKKTAPQAEALYILGDLFEYWAGDDDLDTPFHHKITGALRALSKQGTRIFIMHGNRDFLMQEKLAESCDATLLADPTPLDLYGTPTLLSHGDALCTDDTAYQEFRLQVRDANWQRQFLALPLMQRKAHIEQLRERSESEKQHKTMGIMDVNPHAVHALLQQYNYPRLIHGHTHRPAHHLYHLEGHTFDRWVLGDWEQHANALRCTPTATIWEVFPD